MSTQLRILSLFFDYNTIDFSSLYPSSFSPVPTTQYLGRAIRQNSHKHDIDFSYHYPIHLVDEQYIAHNPITNTVNREVTFAKKVNSIKMKTLKRVANHKKKL